MNLRQYINDLDAVDLANYAKRCCIRLSYMRIHVKYASKDPSVTLIKALARESEGHVSLIEVLEHYGITDTAPVDNAA